MEISHIYTSNAVSGTTSLDLVTVNQTFTKGHTLLAFMACHDVRLNPVVPPDWLLVHKVDGISGSTYIFLNQPTGTTVNPSYTISGLSNQLNTGQLMILSGCNYHSSKVVNRVVGRDNSGTTTTGTDGFSTTVDKTMIVQFDVLFKNLTITTFASTPSLTWTERRGPNNIQPNLTSGVYTIHTGIATSSLAPIDNYTSIKYTITPTPDTENISISVALTPRKTNISMSMSSL